MALRGMLSLVDDSSLGEILVATAILGALTLTLRTRVYEIYPATNSNMDKSVTHHFLINSIVYYFYER